MNNFLLVLLLGFFSAVISGASYIWQDYNASMFLFYFAPGIIFGVFVSGYFLIKDVSEYFSFKLIAFVFLSALSYFAAVSLAIYLSTGGRAKGLSTAIFAQGGEKFAMWSMSNAMAAAGIFGGALMLLAFILLIKKLSPLYFILLVVLGGTLAFIGSTLTQYINYLSGDLLLPSIIFIWQLGMYYALIYFSLRISSINETKGENDRI